MAEWEDGKTLDEVLDAADQDMYAIKNGQAVKPETPPLPLPSMTDSPRSLPAAVKITRSGEVG